MSSIEQVIQEIQKYRGSGLEVADKLQLQHGEGVIIGKKRKGLSAVLNWPYSDVIFLYYVKGDATLGQMIEFLEVWKKIKHQKSWRQDAKEAIFALPGSIDEKGFSDLRRSTIKEKSLLEGIRILRFGTHKFEEIKEARDLPQPSDSAVAGVSNITCPNCGKIFQYAVPSMVLERGDSYQGRHSCPHCKAKLTVHVRPDEGGSLQWIVTGED